uniref:Uncharacterized protein n=1 Tax=Lepeophtheirus salmonis TaxID=72036 RepID=A0A0K2T034_LEPSM
MPDLYKLSALITLGFLLEVSHVVQVESQSSSSSSGGTIVKTSSVVRSNHIKERQTPPPRKTILHTPEEDLPLVDDGQWYWLEIKAIIGGVLGFWGGVGSLGTLFLVIVLSQRYCCKKSDDKDEGNG